jgi:hypothetical protein
VFDENSGAILGPGFSNVGFSEENYTDTGSWLINAVESSERMAMKLVENSCPC